MRKIFSYAFSLFICLPVMAQTVGNKVHIKAKDGNTYKGTIQEVITAYIVKYDEYDEPVILTKNQFTVEQGPLPIIKKSTAPAPSTQVTTARPGFVSGRVLSNTNQPVSGAAITIFGFTKEGARFDETVQTKADGTYALQVPKGGLYRVSSGFANVLLNDDRYSLPLKPLNNKTALEPAEKGIVANFVLMLTGLKAPDKDKKLPSSYYGQQISLQTLGNDKNGYFPDAIVKITLTPTVLADNSPKTPVTFERTIKAIYTDPGRGYDLDKTNILADIPLGVYTATATITKAGQQPQKMLVASPVFSGTAAPSAEIRFRQGTVGMEIFILNLFFPE